MPIRGGYSREGKGAINEGNLEWLREKYRTKNSENRSNNKKE
jgi:hypothetical protein